MSPAYVGIGIWVAMLPTYPQASENHTHTHTQTKFWWTQKIPPNSNHNSNHINILGVIIRTDCRKNINAFMLHHVRPNSYI